MLITFSLCMVILLREASKVKWKLIFSTHLLFQRIGGSDVRVAFIKFFSILFSSSLTHWKVVTSCRDVLSTHIGSTFISVTPGVTAFLLNFKQWNCFSFKLASLQGVLCFIFTRDLLNRKTVMTREIDCFVCMWTPCLHYVLILAWYSKFFTNKLASCFPHLQRYPS